ncbi:sterile alpha motif domain-containing protein 9-like [Nothobranchius furzeri]|uniref:Sterile alpha motif domain-containing protein 9-like n=1 Tax=Nothobranchius furzeri TaxID=105023 RepID=A0A9D2YZN4_NOTFU|nr:sterile alpha motif domain-containing protein 9-like [Nothobranchius furzeri]
MTERTEADLKEIRDALKAKHEEKDDDVELAERFILSNIVLSNKLPYPPQPTLMHELQTINHRFLETEQRNRSPEFYLLALMLLWPEEQQIMSTEQHHHNLQQYADLMEKAFDDSWYAKYLQGRYLLPLFFLGKGSGLSKWVHKSRLDAIVEKSVNTGLDEEVRMSEINRMWISGRVWHLPEIKHILQPVKTEPLFSSQNHEEEEKVFVCVGGNTIPVCMESKIDCSPESTAFFCLGFNVKGPIVFKVGGPRRDQRQ